jgi:hypothetical protein
MNSSVNLNVSSCRGPDPNGVPRSPTPHSARIERANPSIDSAGFLFVAGQHYSAGLLFYFSVEKQLVSFPIFNFVRLTLGQQAC